MRAMVMKYSINKELVKLILEEINDKNLPINCVTGKTTKEVSEYMIDVEFSFDDKDQNIFNDMLCSCINNNQF